MRQFNVTTPTSTNGVIYTYTDAGLFAGIQVNETMELAVLKNLIVAIKPTIEEFFLWAKAFRKIEVVELQQQITFEMFWDRYDDKARSSKKKSLHLWNRLTEPDRIKAYYHYPTYNKLRANAEKKYCETYLNAELWNN